MPICVKLPYHKALSPLQVAVLQDWDSDLGPLQTLDGTDASQVRVRVRFPLPQVTEQPVQFPQSVQLPSARKEKRYTIYLGDKVIQN